MKLWQKGRSARASMMRSPVAGALGFTAEDTAEAIGLMANAEALVGKNAMSGFLEVMNAAPADIEKLNNAITNCDGTAEKMAATMQDNLAGQLTILKSQLEELAISIGEILMPSIRQIVGWIQGLVDWMKARRRSLSPLLWWQLPLLR